MWEINVIQEHRCDLTGTLIGVTTSTDNGDTQYLTELEYENLLKNRKKNGDRRQNEDKR
tara:strand:- start:2122 stop:2298 length:177 start_codon:yes stop_codon:yes gene_type:complete